MNLPLPLPWPFDREYMQLALMAGVIVGLCAPLIGTFLVQKRMSLMGDGVGHVAFAGVSAGLLFGVWPIWTALVAAVVGAVIVDRLRARGRSSGDFSLAVLFYAGISGGVVLAGLAGSLNAGAVSYLFGSILTVTPGDVVVICCIGAVVVVAIALAHRALFAISLDEDAARVAGVPVTALNTGLAILTAVTVVAGMRIVGVLLVAALMVLPVGTAQLVSKSFRGALVVASAVGVLSVVLGLTAARIWSLAPGGSIVLICVAIYSVTATVGLRVSRSR